MTKNTPKMARGTYLNTNIVINSMKIKGRQGIMERIGMDLRELQAEIRKTGASPIAIFYGKAYGTSEFVRGPGARA
jgi:hypothetical protein